MITEVVKCKECDGRALSDIEYKKFGNKTMKRTIWRCQKCKSPMDQSPLVVKIGAWEARRH